MGPAVSSYQDILKLLDMGMNVARLNMSHGDCEQHLSVIKMLKKARKERGRALAIMMDTKGPEIRVGNIRGKTSILKKKQRLALLRSPITGSQKAVSLDPPEIVDDIPLAATVLFRDGYISSHVIEKTAEGIVVVIENGGALSSQDGVNIPRVKLKMAAVTEQDMKDIIFGCNEGIDLLAASFIQSSDHIFKIKKLLAEQQASHVLVIAKIESALGVQNFDSILQASDGIMVARGDLGVELPLVEVPKLQKRMIRKCCEMFKPVVTATQMLESMIHQPRPTRAEVSDVANAIYDSTSAVMLSGETAIGKYPMEAIRFMRETIIAAERDFDYEDLFHRNVSRRTFDDLASPVALAAVKTAYAGRGKALIVLTTSGRTAHVMARFRPRMPIIAITPDPNIYHQLAFAWGVIPLCTSIENVKQGIEEVSCFALRSHMLHYGDLIVVTSGSPFGVSRTTNMMLVDHIGNVLVRGLPGTGKKVHGKVTHILHFDSRMPRQVQDRLVLITDCDERCRSLLKGAAGIILQNHVDDRQSEEIGQEIARALNIPILMRAFAACVVLKEDQLVTLDPVKGLIFDGVVPSEEEMLARVSLRDKIRPPEGRE